MSTRFRSLAFVLAALVGWTIGGSPACGQTLLSSFENDLTSSIGVDWSVWDNFVYSFTATGATEGSTALEMTHPGAGAWTIQGFLGGGIPLAELIAQTGFVQIDITTADVGEAGDGASPSWREIYFIVNSNVGGWQQNAIGAGTIGAIAADDGGSATGTWTLDLTQPQDANPSIQQNAATYVANGGGEGTYFEIFIALQGDNTGAKAGDYNGNGLVDAADYTTWRDNLDGTELTNETVSPGMVDSEDYDEWKATFGANYVVATIFDNFRFVSAGSGSLSGVVAPEPTSALLALCGGVACLAVRRGRT